MKVPLLEYLDKLEAKAKAAEAKTIGSLRPKPWGRIHDDKEPWGAGFNDEIQTHILATQPKATLALIAKLREAVEIVREAVALASQPRNGWLSSTESPADVINRFQDSVVAWAQIEVPE